MLVNYANVSGLETIRMNLEELRRKPEVHLQNFYGWKMKLGRLDSAVDQSSTRVVLSLRAYIFQLHRTSGSIS